MVTAERLISTRIQEHVRHTMNSAGEKFVIAEDSALTNHMVNFEDASVIRPCNMYYDRFILEAIEISKHKNNFNRETATLSTTWYSLISGLTARVLTDRTDNVPVSYTHLDVYKRQATRAYRRPIFASFRHILIHSFVLGAQ